MAGGPEVCAGSAGAGQLEQTQCPNQRISGTSGVTPTRQLSGYPTYAFKLLIIQVDWIARASAAGGTDSASGALL